MISRADRSPRGDLPAVQNPPGFSHIHGLGINPADGVLYAATHGGLYKIENGRASIVANRYQDTMGFTVVGSDHFVASGHPDLREELPPLLGLLDSEDAGRTWVKKSLLGESDFHVLRYAHGKIWGYDSTSSRLMVSRNGEEWDERSEVVLRDFVVSPEDQSLVIASNGEALRRSEDGGSAWSRMDSPEEPLLLSWEEREDLWLLTVEGLAYRSTDLGGTWDEQGRFGKQPEAFLVHDGRLYAATHDEIYVSKDGAESWDLVYSESR